MSRDRLAWRRGRFSTDYETNEIYAAIDGWQATQVGTTVDYYRFDSADTEYHDVYDEGTGAGRRYFLHFPMPVIHASHTEARREDRPEGFYAPADSLHLTASYDQLRHIGMTRADIKSATYLTDRIVYDNIVFTVTSMQVLGQIQDRDIIVGIDAMRVGPDELVNDPQFKKWSA